MDIVGDAFLPRAIGHESIMMRLPLSEHTEDFTCVLRLQRQEIKRANMFKGSQSTDSPQLSLSYDVDTMSRDCHAD